jgi:hypothetical protein
MAEGGAMRVHGWVVAKEAKAGGRTAGRIAVRAEGNLELRTQLARSAARHENFTPEEATFVLETIAPHFLFRSMTKEQQTRLLMHFQRRTLTPKEVLLKQDEEGAREFYIVSSGCLEVQVRKTADSEPVVVAQLSRSACLGEMALLYACKRTATVTAMVGTEVSLARDFSPCLQSNALPIARSSQTRGEGHKIHPTSEPQVPRTSLHRQLRAHA